MSISGQTEQIASSQRSHWSLQDSVPAQACCAFTGSIGRSRAACHVRPRVPPPHLLSHASAVAPAAVAARPAAVRLGLLGRSQQATAGRAGPRHINSHETAAGCQAR